MATRTRDNFNSLRTAGAQSTITEQSAANCIKAIGPQNPGTPEHIKKYRNSYRNTHGQTIVKRITPPTKLLRSIDSTAALHYGIRDDPRPDEHLSFGVKAPPSEKVKDILSKKSEDGISQLMNEIQESKYHSKNAEPLGRSMMRSYVFPAEATKSEFRFGSQPTPSEYTAKEVVFPPNPYTNTETQNAQYLRSYGSYEAGEQKNRGYNWRVNPKVHAFGKTEQSPVLNEVQQCLQPEAITNQFPKTTIVKKNLEEFRNFKNDQLGIVKNLGQENPLSSLTSSMAFGARLGAPDEWNAGKCINGETTLRDVLPDEDLGKSTRFGFRNTTKAGDEKRSFGLPTIRSDIRKTISTKSIADPTNYGDEKPALRLLFPMKYDYLGVDEADFSIRRYKYEIKDIFEKIGYKYKVGKFEGLYKRALEIDQSIDQKCSAKSFMQAVKEMDHIE